MQVSFCFTFLGCSTCADSPQLASLSASTLAETHLPAFSTRPCPRVRSTYLLDFQWRSTHTSTVLQHPLGESGGFDFSSLCSNFLWHICRRIHIHFNAWDIFMPNQCISTAICCLSIASRASRTQAWCTPSDETDPSRFQEVVQMQSITRVHSARQFVMIESTHYQRSYLSDTCPNGCLGTSKHNIWVWNQQEVITHDGMWLSLPPP